MKGCLERKGLVWYCIFDIKDNSGKRKQKWINTKCKKKSDAEKVLRKILTEIDNNSFIIPEKKTFTEFMKEWLYDTIKNNVEYTTWESYKLVVEKHVIPYFKEKTNDILLSDLQPIHLQNYYTYKHKGDEELGIKPLSGSTLRKHHANIGKALNHAVRMELIKSNPAEKILLPKKNKYYAQFYSVENLEKLIKLACNTPLEAIIYLTINYGFRRSEISALKWDAIDFKEKTITIKEARVKFGNETITKKPKSESSRRVLPLIDHVEDYLKILRKRQKQLKLKHGENYYDLGYVCCRDNGQPFPTDYISHKFKELLEKNNMHLIRFHDIRHSTASYLLKYGVPLKMIQKWLGHADFGTTANIYSHVDYEMNESTAKTISSISLKVKDSSD